MGHLQIAFIIIGWLYLFYLHSRTIRRSEISRLKDRLIDKIESLQKWFSDEINNNKDLLSIEEILAAKTTQIEFRFIQLNHYLKCNLISIEELTPLRNLDISTNKSRELFTITSNIIETIESNYDEHFFRKNILHRFWATCRYELLGSILALTIIFIAFKVLEFIILHH